MSFENALYQWREGERRLSSASSDREAIFERIIVAVVAELRRRLGGTFTSDELAALYDRDTSWCLGIAVEVAPQDPWAWESAVVADAAFGRYLREAVDFAGGRREVRS